VNTFLISEARPYLESPPNKLASPVPLESEFIALDSAGEEAEWLQQFLEDIPLWPKPVPAICIYYDNQTTISRAQNFIYNDKFRCIRRKHNTIR